MAVDRSGAARPAGLLDDVLESQDFEGDAFPPEGWRTFDDIASQNGVDARYEWGLQDIETPREGGFQAPWSIGGGTIGSTIGFGGVYTSEVASVLAYGPIDASDYPEGLTVDHEFYPDLPVRSGAQGVPEQAKSFLVCTDRRDSATNLDCRTLSNEDEPRKRWVGWQEPLDFRLAGGMEEVFVYFIHRDLFPSGEHMGVIIDSVVISGKTTSDPGPGPTPESTPDPGPGPGLQRAFLPLVFNDFDKADFPLDLPTPEPGTIEVHFGTAVDRVTGDMADEGTELDYGIMSLCARQRWQGLAIGTEVRVQWYLEDDGAFTELDPDNLQGINPTFAVEQADGFAFQCIVYADGSGTQIPIPQGRYRNSAFLDGAEAASGSRTVTVRPGDGPPTATPDPGSSPEPTATPAEATPKPTLPANCTDPLTNGDFEQGPSVGWEQQSANQRASILPEGALESSYGVLFGTYAGAQEAVVSLDPVATFAEGEIESATVRWWLRVVSNEDRGNGDNADGFFIGVVGDTNQNVRSLVGISEDSLAPGSSEPFDPTLWYALQADITNGFVTGDGFAEAQLILAGILDDDDQLTRFQVDNVRLELCTPEGVQVMPMRPRAPATRSLVAPESLRRLAGAEALPSVSLTDIGSRPAVNGAPSLRLELDAHGLLRHLSDAR